MTRDEIRFHSERAAAELELARRAIHVQAARAHIGLYALHLERARALGGEPAGAPLSA